MISAVNWQSFGSWLQIPFFFAFFFSSLDASNAFLLLVSRTCFLFSFLSFVCVFLWHVGARVICDYDCNVLCFSSTVILHHFLKQITHTHTHTHTQNKLDIKQKTGTISRKGSSEIWYYTKRMR